MSSQPIGLVLTGGGARGAYQAGVLFAIAELTRTQELPFPILAGSSAGSINAAYLATHAEDFPRATRDLADLWTTIAPHRVFRTDVPTLAKTAAEWVTDLGLGGWIGAGRGKALLDTSPLCELIAAQMDAKALERNVTSGRVHGIGVSATNYQSGFGVTFYQGAADISPWNRVTRIGLRATLETRHVLASSAIPFFFPAVEIDGNWYADGSIRLNTPLSPAIHMGARRILAITVRPAGTPRPIPQARALPYPTPAEAAGVLLNSFFLDALEADVERALRINETLSVIPEKVLAQHAMPLRPLALLVLRPSIDPGSLVFSTIDRFPSAVRHMFRGLGASEESGWELLSYLGFDGVYTTRLFELGYEDTLARAGEIAAFLAGA